MTTGRFMIKKLYGILILNKRLPFHSGLAQNRTWDIIIYNWPEHRLKYDKGSEKPAAHTLQKNDPCTPLRRVSITNSSTIISILVMVLLSILFFNTLVY